MTEFNKFEADDVRTNLDDAALAAQEKLVTSDSPYGDPVPGDQASFAEATEGVTITPEAEAKHLGGFGHRSDSVNALGDKVKDNLLALEKMTPKEFGDAAMKFASDTAYAAAGFANLVAEKAREFAEKQREATDRQRAAFADTAPKGDDPTREFLDQFTAQVNKFVEDLGHTYRDLSERGRETVTRMQAQQGVKADAPKGDDRPGPFDIDDAADMDDTRFADADPTVVATEDIAAADVKDATKDWGQDNR